MQTYDIMLDSMVFADKPTQQQAGGITNRLKTARPSTVTIEQLAQAIEQGRSIVCGVLEGGKAAEYWKRQRLFAIDFDNTVEERTPNGKLKCPAKKDEGALTVEEALQLCDVFRLRPAIGYYSFSDRHDAPEPWCRFRLIFALDREITDRAERDKIAAWFVEIFGGAPAIDTGCKNADRLFYGSRRGSVFLKDAEAACSAEQILAEIRQHEQEIAEAKKLEDADRKLTAKAKRANLPDYNPEDFNADPDELLDLVDPNELNYQAWVSIGAAYRSAGGTAEAWAAWCGRYAKNNERESARLFAGVCNGSGRAATLATLKYYAQQHNPAGYRQYMDDLNARQRAAIEQAKAKKKAEEQLSSGEKKQAFTVEFLAGFLDEHRIRCRYNDILHRIEVDGIPQQYEGERAQAQAATVILSMLRGKFVKGAGVNLQSVEGYIDIIASQRHYNPVAEILDGIVWDGRSRVPDLIDALNLPDDDDLSPVLVRKWLRQAISLAIFNDYRRPYGGDGVLVLCGPQGIGKTTFARILGINPELFKGGLVVDPHDKDTLLKATSCFVGEVGELETTMKRDIPALKSFFSAESDEIRKPYGRTTEKTTRRSSYIATCNSQDFLLDHTGNRRFWTVPCSERFDLDALQHMNVVQLWAEVLAKVRAVGPQSFRLTPSEQEQLAQRNGAHTALLPAQAEVMDILSMTQENPAFRTVPRTVTEFKEDWPALRSYTVKQIGQALDACGVPQKRVKCNGEVVRARMLPQRHYDSVTMPTSQT